MAEHLNKNEETKTGFEGIGERIELLEKAISKTDEGSISEIGSSNRKQPETPSRSSAGIAPKPIKFKLPSKLSATKIFLGVVALVIVVVMFSQKTEKKSSEYDPSDNGPSPRAQAYPEPAPVPAPAPAPVIGSHNSSDDDVITDGQYRCSQYHHNRAGELEPTYVEKQDMKKRQRLLKNESDELNLLKSRIENDYVDEYSQSSINRHNALIDEYNSRLEIFKINVDSFQKGIDNYNARVNTYNNYLIANCRKAY